MTPVVWAPVVVLWITVCLRFRQRDGHAPRALWVGLLSCAVAATINAPAVAVALDSLPWLPANTSQMLKHVLVVVAAQQSYEVVRGLSLPEHDATAHLPLRRGGVIVTVALLVTLFLAGPASRTQVPNFTDAFAGTTVVAVYWLVFLAAIGLSLTSMCRLSWSVRRQLAHGPLCTGMTLVTVGTGCGLVYVVGKGAYVIARLSGVSAATLAPAETLTPVPLAGAVLATLTGVTWPRLAASAPVRRVRARYHYLCLARLWRESTSAIPEVQLDLALKTTTGSRSESLAAGHESELLLYRRVIEILDAELSLLPRADPQLCDQAQAALAARRLPPRDRRAVARRLNLDLALAGRRDGAAPRTAAASPQRPTTTLAEEVRDLQDVARARRPARRIMRGLTSCGLTIKASTAPHRFEEPV